MVVTPADSRGCASFPGVVELIGSGPEPPEFNMPNADTWFIIRQLTGGGRRAVRWRINANRVEAGMYIDMAWTATSLGAAVEAFQTRRRFVTAEDIGDELVARLPSWVIAALPSRFVPGEDIYRLVRILKRPIAALDPVQAALCLARLLVTALRIDNVVVARAIVEWFLAAPEAEAIRREPIAWEYVATAVVHRGTAATGDSRAIGRELLLRIVERVCADDARACGAVVDGSVVFSICTAAPRLLMPDRLRALRSARAALASPDDAVDPSAVEVGDQEVDGEVTDVAYQAFEQRMRDADDANDALAAFQDARQHAEQTSTLMPAAIWVMGLQAASKLHHISADALTAALASFVGERDQSSTVSNPVWTHALDGTRTMDDRPFVRALAARVLDGHAYPRDAAERGEQAVGPAIRAVIGGLLDRSRQSAALHEWRKWIVGRPGANVQTVALGARLLSQTQADVEVTGFDLVSAFAARPIVPITPPAYAASSPGMTRLLSEHADVASIAPRFEAPIAMDATVLITFLRQLVSNGQLLDLWALWTLAPSHWAGPLYNAQGAAGIVRAGMILSAGVESVRRPPWLLRAVGHDLAMVSKPSLDGVTGEDWASVPAWRRARELFWEIVVGNHPHLADLVRSPLQGVGYVNQALAWTGLLAAPAPSADAAWRPASVHLFRDVGRLAQAPYPSIIPDAALFHEFVSLAAVHGFPGEIPVALAWMRALEVRPRRATIVNALVMFENLATTDALEMAGLRRWLADWLGETAVPTTDELTATLFGRAANK